MTFGKYHVIQEDTAETGIYQDILTTQDQSLRQCGQILILNQMKTYEYAIKEVFKREHRGSSRFFSSADETRLAVFQCNDPIPPVHATVCRGAASRRRNC